MKHIISSFQSDFPMACNKELKGDELWQGGEGQPRGGVDGPEDRKNHLRYGLWHYVQVRHMFFLSHNQA